MSARVLLLTILYGVVRSFPVQESSQIFFPGDPEVQAKNSFSPETEQRTYFTKTHHVSGEDHQPIHWSSSHHQPSASGSSYGSSSRHVSYSGAHPAGQHHVTYSAQSGSYGAGGSGQHSGSYGTGGVGQHSGLYGAGGSGQHSGSYGTGGMGQHSGSYGTGGMGQHSGLYDAGATGLHSGSYGTGGMGQHTGSYSTGGSQHTIHQTYPQEQHPSASYGSTHHTVVSGTGERQHNTELIHSERENGVGPGYSVLNQHAREESTFQHAQPEKTVESFRQEQQVGDSVRQISSGADNERAVNIAAEEHQIIEEMKQLVGITSSPHASTMDPIAQQQQIIREMKDLVEPSPPVSSVSEGARQENDQGTVNSEVAVPAVDDSTHTQVKEVSYVRPGTSQEHHREEIVETPILKEASHYGSLGGGHRTHSQTIHTETREESHRPSHSARSTPDPLDLANLLDAYNNGDFKPGSARSSTPQPTKELDPEIKQAIDNIMREWEVIPDREGKPVPPPRNYKVTKHVKVTKTTHNRPVVQQPAHTITKVTRTETVHPSSGAQRKVIRHHINIAELLEQLRQIESSNHHRNITWCEEKIKEFLTELNQKEESGIEINQSVQEETLHHILTQDHTVTHDQTITKEVHHEIGHDAGGEVVEEPFVKKTVVELGLNEPTRPPSYWTEEETKHETHAVTGGETQPEETNAESGSVKEVVHETEEMQPGERDFGQQQEVEQPYIPPEAPKIEEERPEVEQSHVVSEAPKIEEEQHIFTGAPNQEHVPPLESLSHQKHEHSSSETTIPHEKDETIEEVKEVENPANPVNEDGNVSVPPAIPERPAQPEIEEFKGENQVEHRPLPPNYHPRVESEEEEIHQESSANEINDRPKENHQVVEDHVINHEETKEGQHNSNEELSVELPFYNETNTQNEVKTEEESQSGREDAVIQSQEEHQHTGGHYSGGYEVVNQEEGAGGSSHHETVEHVIHELGGQGHSGGSTNTEYTEETVEHHPGGEHHSGGSNTEYTEETVEHHPGGEHHSGGSTNTEYTEETVEHHPGGEHHSGGSNTEYTEETVEHHPGGEHHSGGSTNTEYTEETVEHHPGGEHHSGGSTNTEYTEETVEHHPGGEHHSGGSNTEYTEETVEHHPGGGEHVETEINYDQLIEELISLESLPGHQAIDKCDEKIRQFLEVLKRQQERGFDENKVELERLRRLIEEMQAQRRSQQENGSIPQSTEAPTSFWKKVGRKIKATLQHAKTKANDILSTDTH